MLRINSLFANGKNVLTQVQPEENSNKINGKIDSKKPQQNNQTAFTSENPMKQSETLPIAQPTYDVKTPIAYKKTEELNLPYETKAHCYKLSNGQKIVIVPKEGATVVKTYVNTGSMNEPDNLRGISHYIEHNLFNGSEGLEKGDFFKVVDKMGASTNASTGFAETNYFISSHLLNKDDLEKKIKIHASMLQTPLFANEKLAKEKDIVNSEINMILSNPENIAVNKTIKNLYNIKSSSLDMIGGTTDNITNLTKENVTDYFNNNYYPANMVTVITGEVKPEKTIELVAKYFTSKKQPPKMRNFEELNPIKKTVREDIISEKAKATSIIMGFNGPKNVNTKDKIYMEALGRLLVGSNTSRINKNLKQYNTAAFAEEEKISNKSNSDFSVLFSADGTEDNAENIIKTIYSDIYSIQKNPPNDEEMQIIKKKMITNFSKSFETSFDTNNEIGSALINNNLDYINNYEKTVNEMTSDDLVRIAKEYLDLNKVALTVVHPNTATIQSLKQNYDKASSNNVSFTGNEDNKNISKTAINIDNLKQFKLPNNFVVVTNDIKTRNCALNITFEDEKPIFTAKPATAFVLNNLLSEGSLLKDEHTYSRELEKKGIQAKFMASDNGLEANVTFDADDMESALKATKEVLLNPRFEENSLKQVKNDIKDIFLKSNKNPYEKLDKALFPNELMGYTKEEILNSLDDVTLDDVKTLYNSLINNAQASIVVSAPFEKKSELKETLFKEALEFKSVNEFNKKTFDNFKPVEQTTVLTDTDNRNQASIVEAYKFKVNGNIKDAAAVALLNTILGGGSSSRLFNDLREKEKLAYSVHSNLRTVFNSKVLTLSIGTTTENKDTGEVSYDNLKKSVEGFNRNIQKIKTEKVSEEELSNAKLSIKNGVLNENETACGKTDTLSGIIKNPYGLYTTNEFLKILDDITVEDIYNSANYVFGGKAVYSIVATKNTLEQNAAFLNSLKAG